MRGWPLENIEAWTHLNPRTRFRMFERALAVHPDGRPWGFRVLIPALHTKAYERSKPTKARAGKNGGLAGAFAQLRDRHDRLERLVRGNVARGDKLHISFYHVRYTRHCYRDRRSGSARRFASTTMPTTSVCCRPNAPTAPTWGNCKRPEFGVRRRTIWTSDGASSGPSGCARSASTSLMIRFKPF